MKNSPENNFWNEVRNRLDNYAEEPADDSWDKIAGAINPRPQPRIIAWLERRASSAQVGLAGFAVVVGLVASDQSATVWNDRSPEATVESVETDHPTAPAAEKIAAADVVSDASAQANGSPSADAGEQARSTAATHAYSTTAATTPAITEARVTTGKRTPRSTSGKARNTNGKTVLQQGGVYANSDGVSDSDKTSALDNTAESGAGVQQMADATKGSTASDQASTVEASPVAESDEAQQATNAGDQTSKQMASVAVVSVIDTTGQKDANKKKKEQAVAAKDKKEAEKKKAQLHIPMVYFQVGPSLAYHKITPSTNDNVTITDLEEPGVFASDRTGLSVEAGFQYRVAPRIEVYGGLSYYHQNQHIRYTVADASAGSVTGNAGDGYVFTPVITKHDVNYTMRNAGVSAGMFYRIKTHLLEHKFGVGLLYQQGFKKTSGEGSTYTNDGSKYLQYQLQYRMEAGLNDHMRLYFQPGYTHAFHVDEKLNEPFTIKPYRAGISVGIVYLFGK